MQDFFYTYFVFVVVGVFLYFLFFSSGSNQRPVTVARNEEAQSQIQVA